MRQPILRRQGSRLPSVRGEPPLDRGSLTEGDRLGATHGHGVRADAPRPLRRNPRSRSVPTRQTRCPWGEAREEDREHRRRGAPRRKDAGRAGRRRGRAARRRPAGNGDRTPAGMAGWWTCASCGVPRIAVLPGLARREGALQADGAGHGLGLPAAADHDGRLRLLPGADGRRRRGHDELPAVRLRRRPALDLLRQRRDRGRQQRGRQSEPGRARSTSRG